MIKAALIGISNYARQHLLVVGEQMLQGRLQLSAATVVNQKEEAFFCDRLQQLGCRVFDHTDRMWAEFQGKIDLCFIPTGIHLHASMTLQALRAGASVLVEKPLAASLVQARQIMELERQTGRFVAVGFQDLYTPSTWKIKRELLAGRVGEVRSVSFSGLWPRSGGYYTRNDWAGRLQQNGQMVADSPVSNAFAHFLNLGLFWAGEQPELSAQPRRVACELYRTQAIESFDTCCARVDLPTGCQLRFYVTHSCREDRNVRLTVKGTKGTLIWEHEKAYEYVDADGSREQHAILGKFETKIAMADAVTARVRGENAPMCSTAIALEHLRLIEALHTSGPIRNVPAQFLEAGGDAGGWTVLRDIESAIDEADRRECLWSDLGLSWAVPAATATLPEWPALESRPTGICP